MADLLQVEDALERIVPHFRPLPAETVPLPKALGRVLAGALRADTPLPPFANSSMDGFAIYAADSASANDANPVALRVVMDIPAGTAPTAALAPGQAARIMTGAPIPEGADAVIPVELTDQNWRAGDNAPLPEQVLIKRTLKPGDNVRAVGEDIQNGQVVLPKGTLIRPAEIGVLAALGVTDVPVMRKPRVAIISTGDELREIDEPLEPGSIRDSNRYTLAALVQQHGGRALRLRIARDTRGSVRLRFRQALRAKPNLILSSAGVSVGTFDVVREVLSEMGKLNIWRVNIRPGKPLTFGTLGGIPFFGLPGNPVSAMVTFDVFVRPALDRMLGRVTNDTFIPAVLDERLSSDGRRSYIRVKLHSENGRLVARTTGTQSSGALMSMVLADGLLILPEGTTQAEPGDVFPVRLFHR